MTQLRMMPLVAGVAIVLALAGCSPETQEPNEDAADRSAAAPSPEPTEAAPSESPEPLTAGEEPTFSDLDDEFLFELRKRTDIATIVQATDQQLVDAGHAACEALAVNPDVYQLRLIDGEVPREDGRYFESAVIGTHAQMVLCP